MFHDLLLKLGAPLMLSKRGDVMGQLYNRYTTHVLAHEYEV